MHIYNTFDTVIVPFPFTDLLSSKLRPAVVLSGNNINNATARTVFAMITSSTTEKWPLDSIVHDLASCGLERASYIRLKIFTLDNTLIVKKIGCLSKTDQVALRKNMLLLFNGLL